MAKPEWGTKRTCLNCGVRFYDLGSKPITCPSCKSSFEPEAFVKTRRSRQSAPVEAKKPAPEPEAEAETKKADADADDVIVPDDDDEALGDDVDEEDDAVLPVEADDDDDSDDVGELIDKPGGSKEEA